MLADQLVSEKEFLSLFGWDDYFANQWELNKPEQDSSKWHLARVICEERGLYRVQMGAQKILSAAVSGKMQFGAKVRSDFPAVGDWVLLEIPQGTDRGIIQFTVPRKTIIFRKQIGSTSEPQILSTNVDYVFITTSVNEDLNFRRIERYLSIARDANCTPVILLTKADIRNDMDQVVADVRAQFPEIHVQALSKNNFEDVAFFRSCLRPGTTSIILGSSGVGKSTLANFLIGEETAKTQEIRDADSKGRHTTTSRNLYVSRYGGLIIDTPGMRELQLSDHAEGVRAEFSEIEEVMTKCKFGDCQHQSEPGCAILAALKLGTLPAEKWMSYNKLMDEARHAERKQSKAAAAEERKLWKKRTVDVRELSKTKKGKSD
jgi:ribosome biogenesis GTPase / thiamine phosphate phosphatase